MYAEPGVGGPMFDEELSPENIRISKVAMSSAFSHSRWMLYCLLARGEVPGALMTFVASSHIMSSSFDEVNVLREECVGSQNKFVNKPVPFAALRRSSIIK